MYWIQLKNYIWIILEYSIRLKFTICSHTVLVSKIYISSFWFQKYFIILVAIIFHHCGHKNILSLWSQIYFITWSQKYFIIWVPEVFHHFQSFWSQNYSIILITKTFHHFNHKNISLLWSQKYFIIVVPKIFHHFGFKNISSLWSQKIFHHFCPKNILSFDFQNYFLILGFENISTFKQEMELFWLSSYIGTFQ